MELGVGRGSIHLLITSERHSMADRTDPRCILDVSIPPEHQGGAECGVCRKRVLADGMAKHLATGVMMCASCTRQSLERVKVLVSA
jgi:hypothetical protein